MLFSDTLLRETRLRFPSFDKAQIKITPIEKGGSARKFYRVQFSPEHSIVLLKYNDDAAENQRYVEIAEFLVESGIRAPKIYFHDPREGLIWLEDLGECDLWSYRGQKWERRRTLYQATLAEVKRLHHLPAHASAVTRLQLSAQFDAGLYLWEQRYFFENCLGRYFGVSETDLHSLGDMPALRQIAERLAGFPRVLIHRDFQSQNVIIRDGAAYLIDFQGMRPGLAEYDVASLLYDPYVRLGAAERSELVEFYLEQSEALRAEFVERLNLCAMQRLMQALGAYAYLGLVRGNKSFLDHIPGALQSLGEIVAEMPGFDSLGRFLRQLRAP